MDNKEKGMIAAVAGIILILTGLLLAVTNVIVYGGEWPDERPIYLAGVGYPVIIIGIYSVLAGVYFYMKEPKAPATQIPEIGGKEPG